MRTAFQTLDGVQGVKECPDLCEGSTTAMGPLWSGAPTAKGNPPLFQQWRKYERVGETLDGTPLFGEVAEPLIDAERRAKQQDVNVKWLVGKIDEIHAALCPEHTGTWQMRAEHAAIVARLHAQEAGRAVKPGDKIEEMKIREAKSGLAHDSKSGAPVVFLQLDCEHEATKWKSNIYLAVEPSQARKLAAQLVDMADRIK